MAHFEGIFWANHQLRYLLKDKKAELLGNDAKVFAVSRSIHYALFLVFEGIRFLCKRNPEGEIEIVFVNWEKNLERFRNGIAFNLSSAQQILVPSVHELKHLFLSYFRTPEIRPFLEEMIHMKAQGYLRPFTVDEEQSIGVSFPANPSIRVSMCRYDRYLGEPFDGVVIPIFVRAAGINGTGCLKLGINYLMSVKAVDKAGNILPSAASALFLDDNPWTPLRERHISEWDSSCCLIALRNGTVVKIPESPLILPSVTIQGVVTLLRRNGVNVEERHFTYGELIDRAQAKEIIAVCSVGTAGILNRCRRLVMVDMEDHILADHFADSDHELFQILGKMKTLYWNIYSGIEKASADIVVEKYTI